MRWTLILLGILMISFVVADSSTSKANFTIEGCSFIFEGETIGVPLGECSWGESYGFFYCDDEGEEWITSEAGYGCTRAESTYENGNNSCCPVGMRCVALDSGLFQCKNRGENCFDYDGDRDGCEDADCDWLPVEEICVDGVGDLGCGYYNSSTLCAADNLEIGTHGVGTESCGRIVECDGTSFVVSCGCEWISGASGGKCQLNVTGNEAIYSGVPKEFSCSNSYILGACEDGEQTVTWNSISSGATSNDCLVAAGCSNGEDKRFCGEEIIKLPGVSLFSLLFSLFIIGIYYSRKI